MDNIIASKDIETYTIFTYFYPRLNKVYLADTDNFDINLNIVLKLNPVAN